ncbi:SpoIIE family protein phosphatase [Streptomyces sp. NPDC001380]|uniref:ATP-binding SpoIIE family protein phosphatase n=1 Tax=Streptomyces sp. NPDC001380 TaxID=3364566 RepID=UPI0036A0E03E
MEEQRTIADRERVDGVQEPVDVRQDRLLAEALRRVVRSTGALFAMVYRAGPDGTCLTVEAIGGTPPQIFTTPNCIPRDSPYASAAAWRTGRPVSSGLPLVTPGEEAPVSLIPHPYSVASVPLPLGKDCFGVLSAVWMPPRPSELPRLVERLTGAGEALTAGLARLGRFPAGAGTRTSPMIVPVLDPGPGVRPQAAGASTHRWGLPDLPGSSALSQMFQLHQLSAALNRASGTGNVVRTANEWITKSFGADTLVVTVAAAGRLRVVGHSGASGLVGGIHGAPLDRRIPASDVQRSGEPLFLPDRGTLLGSYSEDDVGDLRAMAVLPATGSGQVVGSLMLGFGTERDFGAEERTLLLMMAERLGGALEREQLSETEHALTGALQKKLLPRILPEWSEMATTARYLSPPSASGMGGDWYDVIPLPGRQVGLVVGDVEGHHADSAVIMGQLRSGLHAYATEGHDPAAVLARSNALLAELDTDLYATCCLVRIDLEFGVAEIALAGHPPPLLRGPDGCVVLPDAPPNLPLGVTHGHTYTTAEVPVLPGTLLMLYTNGIGCDPVADARALLESADGAQRCSLDGFADIVAAGTAGRSRPHADDTALLFALFEGSPLGPVQRVDRMSVPRHDIQGVRAARRFVRGYLTKRGLSRLTEDLEVIASEAVTNALIHADSEVEVRLREYPDRIHLEVRDTDAKPPIPTSVTDSDEANAVAEHGRGMGIVEYLSTTWGSSPNGRGKTVWADLAK